MRRRRRVLVHGVRRERVVLWCDVLCCVLVTIEQKPGRRCEAELRSLTGHDESRRDSCWKQGKGDWKRQNWSFGDQVMWLLTHGEQKEAVSLSLFTGRVKTVMHTSEGLCKDCWSSFQCSRLRWSVSCAQSDVTRRLLFRCWFLYFLLGVWIREGASFVTYPLPTPSPQEIWDAPFPEW